MASTTIRRSVGGRPVLAGGGNKSAINVHCSSLSRWRSIGLPSLASGEYGVHHTLCSFSKCRKSSFQTEPSSTRERGKSAPREEKPQRHEEHEGAAGKFSRGLARMN